MIEPYSTQFCRNPFFLKVFIGDFDRCINSYLKLVFRIPLRDIIESGHCEKLLNISTAGLKTSVDRFMATPVNA